MEDEKLIEFINKAADAQGDKLSSALLAIADNGARNRRSRDNKPIHKFVEHPATKFIYAFVIPLAVTIVLGLGAYAGNDIISTQAKTVEALATAITNQAVVITRLDHLKEDVTNIDGRIGRLERKPFYGVGP